MTAKRLPELMTARMIREETGLPESTVVAIIRRIPKVPNPTSRVLVKRADVMAALEGKMR